jgi:hypothetical protein
VTLTAFDEYHLAIEGSRFATQEQAFEAGKLARQQLSVTIASTGVALDFDPPPLPERNEGDRPEAPEAPGLHVFPTPEGLASSPRFIADGQLSQPLERIIAEDLALVRQVIPNGLTPRLNLAYSIFHTALGSKNPEIRYVMFVAAIEALIDAGHKPEPILKAIAALRQYVKQSDQFAEVQNQLDNLLREEKKESITHLGMQLASQLTGSYGDEEPATYFKAVYTRRSRIVHGVHDYDGKNKRPTAQEIKAANPELQRFVTDLLIAESAK